MGKEYSAVGDEELSRIKRYNHFSYVHRGMPWHGRIGQFIPLLVRPCNTPARGPEQQSLLETRDT
jgi:hypothetical protein